MKRKILAIIFALALIMPANLVEQNMAYAITNKELADNLDPSKLEAKVAAARYLLENYPNTVKGSVKKKLEVLLKKSQETLDEVYAFKRKYGSEDTLAIRVKNQIRENLRQRKTDFTVNINSYADNDQISQYFLETCKEDPYFFYSIYEKANVSSKYNSEMSNGSKIYIDSARFIVTYRENQEIEKKIEEFANNWVQSNINTFDSDFDKVLKIHDFIVTQNQYNLGDSKSRSGGYSIYNPASILFGNGGVCNAYATLFDKLANLSGLEVRYATGISKKNSEPHIWNMVKIDGNWMNVDATWDDPTIRFDDGYVTNIDDFVIYDYFLKSDEQMRYSRIIDEDKNRPLGLTTMDTGLKNSTIKKIDDTYMVVK